MTEIKDAHVEWAVVDRLRQMLEHPPATDFNVTHTYALFTAVLCWVMQRIRAPDDEVARSVREELQRRPIVESPWCVQTSPEGYVARVGSTMIHIPAATGFNGHTAIRFAINLRDATAHGDARNVRPFHTKRNRGADRQLIGFTFDCAEKDQSDRRRISWKGSITLLEADMRRIAANLAKVYCHVMQGGDEHFGPDAAAHVKEVAA